VMVLGEFLCVRVGFYGEISALLGYDDCRAKKNHEEYHPRKHEDV